MSYSDDAKLKSVVRGHMFRHLDGLAIGTTLHALEKAGVVKLFLEKRTLTLPEIQRAVSCNLGYLNVGLRLLACQGWLQHRDLPEVIEYCLTPSGEQAFQLAPLYAAPCQFLDQHPILIEMKDVMLLHRDEALSRDLQNIAQELSNSWGLKKYESQFDAALLEQVHHHLDGLIVAPFMVVLHWLGLLKNVLAEGGLDTGDLGDFDVFGDRLIAIFEHLGWIRHRDADYVELTSAGKFAVEKVHTYGVIVSYLPTLIRVPTLLFGDPNEFAHASQDGLETHVDRVVNVWASGASHRAYFAKLEPILIEIFNQPLERQPQGVAEMGCGDGTMLCFIHDVIKTKTLRGKNLATHPVIIVGSDFNQAAREVAAVTFQRHGIPHHLLHGDINDPGSFAQELERLYGRNLADFLSVRAFIDHERNFRAVTPCGKSWHHPTHAAFADAGRLISTPELMDNLVDHLQKWHVYAHKHGLAVIELHTLDPALASRHLGQTLVTPYDAIHGYTDQYPVELSAFQEAAAVAGFKADASFLATFPPGELATISVQWLRPLP